MQSMSDKDKNPKNVFYENSIKLLANKFMKEFQDKGSEYFLLHEGYERTYEVWSKKYISSDKIKEDVWNAVIKRVSNKNG